MAEPLHICGAVREDRVCIRLAGEKDYRGLPHDQHRSADGKRWYYSDGEKDAQAGVPLVDLLIEHSSCPYCGVIASGVRRGGELGRAEIAHMEAEHPEIIIQRLRDAGMQ